MYDRVNALLVLVEEAERCALVGIYDSEDAGDAFADIMDASEFGRASSDLASSQLDQLSSFRQHPNL
jgi:hypothetical protein